ncbi:hypothetical protein HK100_004514 [Physocladia obscura]|uniref:GATA-type domain-containing protein n=1 Tax=Physocladia obscura TaxID=109957 RepID=A0AAD5SVK1_9FUNG|nr:hypothetical protein HK100_004514 [Physocladia obscura]
MLSPTYAFDPDCDIESLLFMAEERKAFTFEPPTPPQQHDRSFSADYTSEYTRSNSTSSCDSQLVIASNGFMIPNDQFSAYEFLLRCSTNLAPAQHQTPNLLLTPTAIPSASPVMIPVSPLMQIPVPVLVPAIDLCGGACSATPILLSHNYSFINTNNNNNANKTLCPARIGSVPQFATMLHPRPLKPKPICANCGGTETSVWRKDCLKNPLCNACGLFRKQHGYDRPQSFPFRKTSVQRRKGKKGSAIPRS